MNPFSLEGQTALITDGGTGLGFGIATSFVQAGAKVVIVGRREEELSKAVATLGDSASYQVHDITQLDQAQSLIDRVTDSHGGINILVNNAGIHIKKKAVETTDEDFQRMMQTHVFGAYALTRAVIPQMAARGATPHPCQWHRPRLDRFRYHPRGTGQRPRTQAKSDDAHRHGQNGRSQRHRQRCRLSQLASRQICIGRDPAS